MYEVTVRQTEHLPRLRSSIYDTMAKDTMRAVVFKGPGKVVLEDRPIPKIQDPTDIIVKVNYTALCGRYV